MDGSKSHFSNIGRAVSELRVDDLTDMLNEYRTQSGFPQLAIHEVAAALRAQQSYYREVAWAVIHRLSERDKTRVLNHLIEGQSPLPPLLHDVIDQYAFEEAKAIKTRIEGIGNAADGLAAQMRDRATSIQISNYTDCLIRLVTRI